MLAIIAHNISDVNRILNCVWRGEVAVYEDSGATQMLQKISLILVKSKNETKVDPQNPIYMVNYIANEKWKMWVNAIPLLYWQIFFRDVTE